MKRRSVSSTAAVQNAVAPTGVLNRPDEFVVGLNDLRADYGIPYSRPWLYVLIKQGKFPKPFKLGPNRVALTHKQVIQYLRQRAAEGDAKAA